MGAAPIPFAPDFFGFVRAGRRLEKLHTDYEKQPQTKLTHQINPNRNVRVDWRVEKMKLSKDRKSIVYNDLLTLTGIPEKAFDYKLGNRSAIEWVIDQYQVSTDKRSGIVQDPNKLDDEEYIVRLIGQVIHVSLETLAIFEELPPLK